MRYILQLSTGSFGRSTLKEEDVIQKLDACLEALEADKVIFGWAQDDELNQRICEFLDARQVEKYLWLPVFAEIQDFKQVRRNKKITEDGNARFHVYEGDAFEFACQSDENAIEHAEKVFDRLTRECHVEGVFLDRIRYASVATSPAAIYGCWCPQCQDKYREKGIDTEKIEKMAEKGGFRAFLPEQKQNGVYRISDPDVDMLMEVKRELISRQVAKMCRRFRTKGLKIGIDTFAPVIADFVGQDLVTLGKMADFVKPMIYLRTDAPAGLPFELEGMGDKFRERLNELWGGAVDSIPMASFQISGLRNAGIPVAPGIDVNEIEGICSADTKYVENFLRSLEEAGCHEVVLSWDAMRISKEMIKNLAVYKG